MAEQIENKNTEVTIEQTTKNTTNETNATKSEKPEIDVEKIKSDAVSDYVKSLGIESGDKLQKILKKVKEDEDKNKSELERTGDILRETTKQLAEEREARQLSDAKLAAIKLGANPKLVDDLVVIAKAKTTKDKKIEEVIAEIKDGETGSIYFSKNEEETENKNETRNTKNVTRKKPKTKDDEEEEGNKNNKYAGSMAERIFAKKKKVKSSYFSN